MKEVVHWDLPLKVAPFLTLLLPGCLPVSSLPPHVSTILCLAVPMPWSQPWTNASETVSQKNSFFLEVVLLIVLIQQWKGD